MARQEEADAFVNILGQGTLLKGDVRFDDHTLINGEAEGAIQVNGELVIGESARIKASLKATSIKVEGRVQGNIDCEGVLTLTHTAHIEGDIKTMLLRVEEGGIVQGRIIMQKQHDQMPMMSDLDDNEMAKKVGV